MSRLTAKLFPPLILACLVVGFSPLHTVAQEIPIPEGAIRQSGSVRFNADSVIFFRYYELFDTTAFRRFAAKSKQSNCPVVAIKKDIFDPVMALLQNYEAQLDSCRRLEEAGDALNQVHLAKIMRLEQMVTLQQERAENFKGLSEDMSHTTMEVNAQLTAALQVAKDCNKGKVRKQWGMALLGGAVGFSVATLIALNK